MNLGTQAFFCLAAVTTSADIPPLGRRFENPAHAEGETENRRSSSVLWRTQIMVQVGDRVPRLFHDH